MSFIPDSAIVNMLSHLLYKCVYTVSFESFESKIQISKPFNTSEFIFLGIFLHKNNTIIFLKEINCGSVISNYLGIFSFVLLYQICFLYHCFL